MEHVTFIFELIGTIAFAVSGAVTGLRAKSDLFGVLALGIITATGGGVIRDVILGQVPPAAFVNPFYISMAALSSLFVFITAALQMKRGLPIDRNIYRKVLFYMDAIGLGFFTVMGCETAFRVSAGSNLFLCVFSGMITGVGGGLLRDMLVDQLPDIFRKYIYAVASIAGGILCAVCMKRGHGMAGIYLGAAFIVVIRMLAGHFHWSLPRLEHYREREEQKERR
ncbi:MAG: trimeric intracellular cation channel family protein [Bulleidia sp.]